ncbi:Response regulator [hydrothermal vent metagenome]|uniref:Response regulator n=1 Tax=hydrothermal vent metagenome TaxID=652676 RepID=A0A3B0YRN0_9ZZZZ
MATKKPSIKTITVKNITAVIFIMVAILLVITGLNFRALSKTAIENQSLAHAELVKAGLTAQMKAGVMAKENFYLTEIRELNKINKIIIIRGEAINQQFGTTTPENIYKDKSVEQAFKTKKTIFTIDEFNLSPTIRAVIPYIANSNGTSNCLSCHTVPEGSVLGVIDITLDVTQYRNQSLLVLASILFISFSFLLLIIVNTSHIIQQNVQEPLNQLIQQTKLAYKKNKPILIDQFTSSEFTSVATEINLFNNEVIANQGMLQEKNAQLIALNDEIESTLRETIYIMGVIEGRRSQETSNHTKRVALYSQLMAKKVGLSPREVELITAASPLHDIGKIGIPDKILLKPSRLSEEEQEIMKTHPHIGYTMLNHSNRDILQAAAITALQHHEKWDGSGYPQGFKGGNIHIYGRIVALADIFDALFSCRVYKESWPLPKVIEYIKNQSGKHLDPNLVQIFLDSITEFVAITERYPSDCPVNPL